MNAQFCLRDVRGLLGLCGQNIGPSVTVEVRTRIETVAVLVDAVVPDLGGVHMDCGVLVVAVAVVADVARWKSAGDGRDLGAAIAVFVFVFTKRR